MSFQRPIGVLMLETRFPRPIGDIGNPETFGGNAIYVVIPTATPDRVVRRDPFALLSDFIQAGHELVAKGAALITTSCGFLALFQKELVAALPVPVVTSSLLLARDLERPAILTIDASALTPKHLKSASVPGGTPIVGMEETRFARSILSNADTLDVEFARQEHVEAGSRLIREYPQTTDIVLECTNMPPYTDAIETATGRPVHSIVSLLKTRSAAQSG